MEQQQRPIMSEDKNKIIQEEKEKGGRFFDMKSIRESLAEAEISAQRSLCAYKSRGGGDNLVSENIEFCISNTFYMQQ